MDVHEEHLQIPLALLDVGADDRIFLAVDVVVVQCAVGPFALRVFTILVSNSVGPAELTQLIALGLGNLGDVVETKLDHYPNFSLARLKSMSSLRPNSNSYGVMD